MAVLYPSGKLAKLQKPSAHFKFEITGNRGATLKTRYKTHIEDAQFETRLEKYVWRHYDSWVAFARYKEYGDDVRPVLVSGVDMTWDYMMLAYSNKGLSIEVDLKPVEEKILASASASITVKRHRICSPHLKCGPEPLGCSPTEQDMELPSQSADPRATPKGFKQCVFIRYYTGRRRAGWLPLEVMKASAGPHDLGSGDNKGDTFPELTAQSSAGPTTSGDENLRWQSDLTTVDVGSGSVIVVRNYV